MKHPALLSALMELVFILAMLALLDWLLTTTGRWVLICLDGMGGGR
jgi:hypothetical protein